MIPLLAASLLWAFSFGLIKTSLSDLDIFLVAFIRLFLSFLIFVPFLRIKLIPRKIILQLLIIGVVQYGVMYIAYLSAFKYLKSYEVAFFTIFTPLFVILIDSALSRRFNLIFLITTVLSVIGTGIVQGLHMINNESLIGFILMQISNLCFASGQIYYRKILSPHPNLVDRDVFCLLYLGALLPPGIAGIFLGELNNISITMPQLTSLLYLGIVSSGLGFFLWNIGARKVNPGTLAIFNDLKIPLAVGVSLFIFGERADLINLCIGGCLVILALFANEYSYRKIHKKTV